MNPNSITTSAKARKTLKRMSPDEKDFFIGLLWHIDFTERMFDLGLWKKDAEDRNVLTKLGKEVASSLGDEPSIW